MELRPEIISSSVKKLCKKLNLTSLLVSGLSSRKRAEESMLENKAYALGSKGASYHSTEGSRTPYQSYRKAPADKRSGRSLLFTSQALNPALGQNIRKCHSMTRN